MTPVSPAAIARFGANSTRYDAYTKALISSYGLTFVNIATYLVVVPWYLRWLGPERYGFWLILLQLFYIASLVTTWIAAPLTRESAACRVADDGERLRAILQTATLYYGGCGAMLIAAALLVSPVFPRLVHVSLGLQAEAARALVITGVSFAVSAQLNLLLSLLNGYQQMHLTNLMLAALTVSNAATGFALLALGAGLVGLAVGQLLGTTAMYFVALFFVWRVSGARLGGRFDGNFLRNLLAAGTGYLGYSTSYLLLQSDTVLIGFVLGAQTAVLFGVAARVVDQVVQLVWRILDSLFPVTAEFAARDQMNLFKPAHRISSKVAIAAALGAAIYFAFFGRVLLTMWVGAENVASQPVIAVLAVVLVMQVFVHGGFTVPYGTNRMGRLAAVAMFEALLKVGLAMVLLPRIGLAGAAISTLLAQFLCTGWYAILIACRITGDTVSGYLRSVVVPLLVPGAVLAVCLWAVARTAMDVSVQILVAVPLGLIAYVVLLGVWGFPLDERQLFTEAARRLRWVRRAAGMTG